MHKNYLYNVNSIKNVVRCTLVEPLSCVIHAYNEILQVFNPNCILIVGLGNIGMLFTFYLKSVLKLKSVFVHDVIPEKERRIIELFECTAMDLDNSEKYDLIIDATNSITGAHFCLNIASYAQRYCMMSHLYGLDTSFIYEMICQKEIHPLFPLRNGNRENILLAIQIIHKHWKASYDKTIEVFPISKIQQVFNDKRNLVSNKQVLAINCENDSI